MIQRNSLKMLTKLLLFATICLSHCSVDVDIVRSDMPQHMQDWIYGEVLIEIGDDITFGNITDVLIDKLNQKYGEQWLIINGLQKNFKSSVFVENTTIIFKQNNLEFGFVKIQTKDCRNVEKVSLNNFKQTT